MMDTWTWTMDVMNLVIFLIEIKLNLVILHPMYSGYASCRNVVDPKPSTTECGTIYYVIRCYKNSSVVALV
jgi:hypothetical protein